MQGYRNYTYICNFFEECCSWNYVLSIEYWGAGGHSSIYQVGILEPHPSSQHTTIAAYIHADNKRIMHCFKKKTKQTFHQKQWPSGCLCIASSATEWGQHSQPRPVLQRGSWCWEELMNLDQRAEICHSISVVFDHEEEIYIIIVFEVDVV